MIVAIAMVAGAAHASDDSALFARYSKAVHAAIDAHWTPLPQAGSGHCVLMLRQLPGGSVLHVEPLDDCRLDAAGRAAAVEAVLAADLLPYAGFERVFSREMRIVLRAD